MTKIPFWVCELDDDQAHMALVTSNAQGELAPLEIGLHALECVGKGKRGRGNKGDGLKAYAPLIGKSLQYVSQLVQAAEVAKCSTQVEHLVEKTKHLVAIHSLPEELWADAVRIFLALKTDEKDEWTVEVTEQRAKACAKFRDDQTIAPIWRETFLPEIECCKAILSGDRRAGQFADLAAVAGAAVATLQNNEALRDEFIEWLKSGVGADSWDIRKVQDKRQEFEKKAAEGVATVAVGEWREWLEKQPEADLILTDPPYSTDVPDIKTLAEDLVSAATAKVKKTGRVFICVGAYPEESRFRT